jgi:hypothetical protein
MEKQKKKHYPKEFKLEAVNLVTKQLKFRGWPTGDKKSTQPIKLITY